MSSYSRRQLLQTAFVAAAAMTSRSAAPGAAPLLTIPRDPFELLGVASGDPTATGVVLWCRLALDLAEPERWGLPGDAYRVTWEVRPAGQASAAPVRSGVAMAVRERAYAVHVEVTGLQPGRPYSYSFRVGNYRASGLTRTAPAPGALADRLRFVACSCAEYENELYFAYDQMAAEQPDFIIHLGDYIYEETYDRFYPAGRPDNRARRLRFDRTRALRTLPEYRRRYAEHKTDRMLQRAHAAAPWIVTWDDHEVDNDYAGGNPGEEGEQDFVARRIAAYRAYFENMPIRLSTLPVREGRRQLYRHLGFGHLLDLYMLDERQYRDPQACRFDKLPGGKNVGLGECPGLETDRTILGRAQEAWTAERLGRSSARWNVLAQGVMFAHLETRRGLKPGQSRPDDTYMWIDTWSGYLPARQRMIDLLARHRGKGPIVLSGDIHAHFVNRVFKDWRKPGVDPVAPEFVSASVSSFTRNLTPIVTDEANRDTIAFYDQSANGYISCTVTPKAFEATMVRLRELNRLTGTSTVDRSARFVVEHGDPEPKKAG